MAAIIDDSHLPRFTATALCLSPLWQALSAVDEAENEVVLQSSLPSSLSLTTRPLSR